MLFRSLESADTENYNFFVTFNPWDENIRENYATIFSKFPESIEFLPFRSNLIPTLSEKLDYNKYFKPNSNMKMPESLRNLFKRSFEKQYGAIDFEFILDFYGMNPNVSLIFANSGQRKILWQHSDLTNQISTNILKEIYDSFDLVVTDSGEIEKKVSEISPKANVKIY